MTRVDFYVPQQQSGLNRFTLACRLAEKAWQAGNRVCITTDSAEDAKTIDNLLWTNTESSFIPHDLQQNADKQLTQVLIAENLQQTDEHQVLINLGNKIPACFSQFERLLEPLDQNEDNLQAGRERYKYYRDCGYPVNNHEIKR